MVRLFTSLFNLPTCSEEHEQRRRWRTQDASLRSRGPTKARPIGDVPCVFVHVLVQRQDRRMFLFISFSLLFVQFDVGVQESNQSENSWWIIHPASKQRSEGEKVRVGDDVILVSVATERYLVRSLVLFIQSTSCCPAHGLQQNVHGHCFLPSNALEHHVRELRCGSHAKHGHVLLFFAFNPIDEFRRPLRQRRHSIVPRKRRVLDDSGELVRSHVAQVRTHFFLSSTAFRLAS